ncbi:MAG: DUF1844 domain-containing protein [Brevinematales bacterium]|nr:DUF1844 domain-containing protein [Brevinematales bacterium]
MSHLGLSFISYIMMLYQSGLIALGRMQNPLGSDVPMELDEARSVIDLLELLQEKTLGNLTDEETHTLDMVLETLRSGYIEELSRAASENKDKPESEITEGDEFEVH